MRPMDYSIAPHNGVVSHVTEYEEFMNTELNYFPGVVRRDNPFEL